MLNWKIVKLKGVIALSTNLKSKLIYNKNWFKYNVCMLLKLIKMHSLSVYILKVH